MLTAKRRIFELDRPRGPDRLQSMRHRLRPEFEHHLACVDDIASLKSFEPSASRRERPEKVEAEPFFRERQTQEAARLEQFLQGLQKCDRIRDVLQNVARHYD